MYNFTIENNQFITKDIISLRLMPKTNADIFNYLPGQYGALGFKKGGSLSPLKCFSFAGVPIKTGELEFGIKVGGAFTQNLSKLQIGSEIGLMGPYGEFAINPRKENRVVMIAGGIGITPILSMIRTAQALNWPIKITLLYGCRTWEETAYAKELISIHQSNHNLDLYFFISQEDVTKLSSKNILNGQITPSQIDRILGGKYNDKSFYLCGPAGMMNTVRNNLLSKNVYPDKIVSEEFSSSGNKKAGGLSIQNKVNLYVLSGLTLGMIFITAFELNKTISKNNSSLEKNIFQEESSLPSSSSGSNSITNPSVSPSPSSQSLPSTSTKRNTYTPPTTGVS